MLKKCGAEGAAIFSVVIIKEHRGCGAEGAAKFAFFKTYFFKHLSISQMLKNPCFFKNLKMKKNVCSGQTSSKVWQSETDCPTSDGTKILENHSHHRCISQTLQQVRNCK